MNSFNLGGRLIESNDRSIRAGGRITRLRPMCWDVLMHLVDHRGEVVSIDSLLEAIWSGRTAEPAYVRKAIHEIRAALEDDAGQIIKTLPKVGYLIDAEVLEEPGPTGRTSNRATASSERTLVYGRLSPGAYTGISRRLRESRKDTTS